MDPTTLLSLAAVAFVHLPFAMAMLHKGGIDVPWVAVYLTTALFYTALYLLRRLRGLRAGLRRRLRSAAIALAAFITAFFFYNFAAGLSRWAAAVVYLGLAAAAYLFYDVVVVVIVDHPAEEAATAVTTPPV